MKTLSDKKAGLPGRTALFALFIIGLILSVAFPFGIGVVVFFWVIATVVAVGAVGFMCFSLLREMLGKSASFGYAPTTAYLAGKKSRKAKKDASSDDDASGTEGDA